MEIQHNVTLAPFTTFGIGGRADYFVKVQTTDELIEAVKWAKGKDVDFFVLGSGANILVGDKGYRGLVIKNEATEIKVSKGTKESKESTGDNIQISKYPNNQNLPLLLGEGGGEVFLTADSGAIVSNIINHTAQLGLSGFEHFAGIPSTIGGALWQNLHFLSPDRSRTVYISEILESAVILSVSEDPYQKSVQGEGSHSKNVISSETRDLSEISHSVRKDNLFVKTVTSDYFHFSYDYSVLHDTHDIVLSATFQLTPKDPQEIQQTIESNLQWRREKHPENAASCSAGSIFKKIEGYGAGRLIQQVGLKGYQLGGAKVSNRHTNFIINTGSATAKDVRNLISLIQEKVKKEFNFTLEPEISFVGEF